MKIHSSFIRKKLRNEFPDSNFNELDLMRQFGITARKTITILENYFSVYQLTKSKFHVLIMLFSKEDSENVALSDISNEIEVTKSTITGLTDGLEKIGYVKRYTLKGEDRRKVFIKITDSGKEFIKQIFPEHLELLSKITSVLTQKEKIQFKNILKKINDNLDDMNKKIKE